MEHIDGYAIHLETKLSFEQAISTITELLQMEGFGILTEIDVAATFKKKLDLDYKPFRILGACNPHYAHQVLSIEPHVSVLLPCNIVIWDEGEYRTIAAMDPRVLSRITNRVDLIEYASEIYQKLELVFQKISNLS